MYSSGIADRFRHSRSTLSTFRALWVLSFAMALTMRSTALPTADGKQRPAAEEKPVLGSLSSASRGSSSSKSTAADCVLPCLVLHCTTLSSK
eukprot:CAMPEP_0177765980 /NCGR_PEP_ID=MMETSP0491_2-20121128/8276_1 /TAXON_ID=63592 /ORGANISM="Tetraselmis chuii, Strain PLY429" /LENGTH=91 /DNA_ID=CAMNT_0019282355 /DNA_START=496 /DNA_END=771 /DNA_ORIENTATION=-